MKSVTTVTLLFPVASLHFSVIVIILLEWSLVKTLLVLSLESAVTFVEVVALLVLFDS